MNVVLGRLRRMRPALRRLAERLGGYGLAGALLLLTALGFWAFAPRLAEQTQQLHAQADRLRARLDALRASAADPSARSAAATMPTEAWLPSVETATADLRVLFDAAQRNRLALASGEYALARVEGAERLQRFEVVLPVKDRYATIKSFVADVLNAIPHASLAELRIERGAANVEQLDARLHFTLFYREP